MTSLPGTTLTQQVAEFVCSDWRGPNTYPSHSAYTSQVADNLGLTITQASAALRRAEARGLIAGDRGCAGEETWWYPTQEPPFLVRVTTRQP